MRRGNGFAKIAAALVLVCGVVVSTAVPSGAAPRWSVVPSVSPTGPPLGELYAVSCSSGADCFAIGSTDSGPLIEHWDGASWAIVPGPASGAGPEAELEGLSCTSATNCFAVGATAVETLTTFTAKPLVLHWDGAHWSATTLPGPTGDAVAALSGVSCTSATNCFAVGASSNDAIDSDQFTGTPFIEHWDGASWSPVASPSPTGAIEAELLGVSCPGVDSCYAVGDYEAPATGGALLEHWDGMQWSIVPDAGVSVAMSGRGHRMISGFRYVRARATSRQAGEFLQTPGLEGVSCFSETSCFAVGFTFSGALTERWDGVKWSVVANPTPSGTQGGELTSVSCASPTDCSAVGDVGDETGSGTVIEVSSAPLQEHWNGSTWTVVAGPKGASLDALGGISCPSTGDCFAVGDSAFVEHWNGSVWALAPFSSKTSQSELNEVSCSSPRDCFAVGTYASGQRVNTLMEHWNGTSWAIVATPTPAGTFAARLTGVSCPSVVSCTAVGFSEGAELASGLIEHWNGKAWSVVPSPAPKGLEISELAAVSCPTATSCTAVGVEFGESAAKVLIERWNGKVWSTVAAPSPGSAEIAELEGVSCSSPTACTAVGNSESFQGSRMPGAATLIERWDGTSWTISASPGVAAAFATLTQVSCASATECDAVGIDSTSAVAPGKTFAEHWNGTSWAISTVPTPAGSKTAQLTALSCRSVQSCYAVGSYSKGSVTKTLVEHRDGARWSIVASANPSGSSDASLSGVSCAGAASCVAVGSYSARDSFFTLAELGS